MSIRLIEKEYLAKMANHLKSYVVYWINDILFSLVRSEIITRYGSIIFVRSFNTADKMNSSVPIRRITRPVKFDQKNKPLLL
jgi:hypothetical protein